VHGLALREQFDRYVAILREHPGVHVALHHDEVVDLEDTGSQLRVLTDRCVDPVAADHVLMLTGHSPNDPRRDTERRQWAEFADQHQITYVPTAYPLEHNVSARATSCDDVVGLAGSGLTAVDVILHLTEGRDGRFDNRPSGLRYSASGLEPKSIVVFSSSGMFPLARPATTVHSSRSRARVVEDADAAASQPEGIFLTREAVERLRASAGRPISISGVIRRQLDFEAHILPIVVLEMAILYYRTLFGAQFADVLVAAARPEFEMFIERGGDPTGAEKPHRLLASVDGLAHNAATAVDAVLTGDATGLVSDPSLSLIVQRYLRVIFGVERGGQLCDWLPQPDQLATAVAANESPWRRQHVLLGSDDPAGRCPAELPRSAGGLYGLRSALGVAEH